MSPELRTWLVHVITTIQFTPVRMGEGYDMVEVDRFLDELIAAVEAGELPDSLVRQAQFTKVRWREGYNMAEVDQLLQRVAAATKKGPGSPHERSDLGPALSAPNVVAEQRGLVSRLFGRGR